MRNPVSLSLSVVVVSCLTACDSEPNVGPVTDDEYALYNYRSTELPDGIPNAPGNGDITLRRSSIPAEGNADDVDGGDIILFDIVGVMVFDKNGDPIQALTENAILSPDSGDLLCYSVQHDKFESLVDADGTVLLSATGTWVIDGGPVNDDLTALEEYFDLQNRLHYSFSGSHIVQEASNSGDHILQSSKSLQNASRWRKLVVAALTSGYCGSGGIE